MLRIEPLGTAIFLPAFVVGYEAVRNEENARLDSIPFERNPFVVLDQQAGGRCMSYPTVAGAVLRIEANQGNGKASFRDLLRGFRAMAEDPDLALLEHQFPTLRQVVYTVGAPYKEVDLRRVQSFLRRFLDVPRVESGLEAFIRFEPCDILYYFGGWSVMSCRLAERGQRRGSYYGDSVATRYAVEQGNVSDVVCDDSLTLDESMLEQLQDLGRQFGRGEPRVYFLWENSD